MLTLGIRYLNGFAAASHGSHEQVEWPPHPGRVFMALVAGHHQSGADRSEREALLWLEKLDGAPVIYAGEAFPRAVVTQFVPVNDKAGPAKAVLHSLPLTRDRQPRTFARAWLADDTVFLHWTQAEPSPSQRIALATLCGKVTRIGHSSSLVQMWLADETPTEMPCWVPDEARATDSLRIATAGTLEELERNFGGEDIARFEQLLQVCEDGSSAKARKEAATALKRAFPDGPPVSRRPLLSQYRGYARADTLAQTPTVPGTIFSPHLLVFTLQRRDGPYRHLDLACTLALTDRWREALISHSNDLTPAARGIISGHAADRQPLEHPHAAFLSLGFVGHPHADGRLSGVALALPANTTEELRAEVLLAVTRVSDLCLGALGRWELQAAAMSRPPFAIRAASWTAHPPGATQWSSVTPVVYDQHPKAKDKAAYVQEATEMISAGCERIGLPRPHAVVITQVSAHLGAPPAHAFPRLRRKDRSERRHTHAILVFDAPVCGPIAVGAGRFRGYGLFRPMEIET